MSFDKYKHLCNHRLNQSLEHFHHSGKSFHAPFQAATPLPPLQHNHNSNFQHLSVVLLILGLHIYGIVQYVLLRPRALPIRHESVTHHVLFLVFCCMYHNLFDRSPVV